MQPDPPRRPSICFVAPKAGPLLHFEISANGSAWGGAEIQQVLIGTELARRSYDVHFVVAGRRQPAAKNGKGITLHYLSPPGVGTRVLRVVHPRWTSLCRALRAANADVYYQRGNGIETGQVALWCRLNRRAFLFSAASDSNADPNLPDLPHWHERLLYRLGLRLASTIVVQTESQQAAFLRVYGLESAVVRSAAQVAPRRSSREVLIQRVLWVGRIHPKKRPEWLLALAERMPDVLFDVAAEVGHAHAFRESAANLPNVVLHGHVSPGLLPLLYEQSAVVICTSQTEGFPNYFLEAWARGIPTVSTVDPDGLIRQRRLGRVGTSLDGLATGLREMLDDREDREACGRRARAYFMRHHAISIVTDAYERVVQNVMASKEPPCIPATS